MDPQLPGTVPRLEGAHGRRPDHLMPRASKICSTPGCPEIVDRGRCPTCTARADHRRGTARQRGYDTRWEAKRAEHLATHPFCQRPGCFTWATDVNHLDGLGPKGPHGFDDTNLEALCHSHHSQHTASEQPGGWNAR